MLHMGRDFWLFRSNVEICAENFKICAKKCWNLCVFLIAIFDIIAILKCKQTYYLHIFGTEIDIFAEGTTLNKL